MDKEQEKTPQETNKDLFAWLERQWGRLTTWGKAVLFIALPVALVGIWPFNPAFVQYISYLIGGLLLLWQISISSRRALAAEETAKAMHKTTELTEKGNIAERFKNAVEHLGDQSVSVRLGGVYALHHIAQEVEEYRERVFEILCAHVRATTTSTAYKPEIEKSDQAQSTDEIQRPTIEIQSILNLLFVETPGREIYENLSANLEGANLSGARLPKANLQGSNLCWTILNHARLSGSNLQKADLFKASLQNAYLDFADLKLAQLVSAKLQDSRFYGTNLCEADLQRAELQGTFLLGADLQLARLLNADMEFTDLRMVDLREANLTGVKNLKIEQLSKAKTLYKTQFPDGMKEEIKLHAPILLKEPRS